MPAQKRKLSVDSDIDNTSQPPVKRRKTSDKQKNENKKRQRLNEAYNEKMSLPAHKRRRLNKNRKPDNNRSILDYNKFLSPIESKKNMKPKKVDKSSYKNQTLRDRSMLSYSKFFKPTANQRRKRNTRHNNDHNTNNPKNNNDLQDEPEYLCSSLNDSDLIAATLAAETQYKTNHSKFNMTYNNYNRMAQNNNNNNNATNLPKEAKQILKKYAIKKRTIKGDTIFYGLSQNYCGGNHRSTNGQNFIYYSKGVDTHSLTIKCRSPRCNFKNVLYHDYIFKQIDESTSSREMYYFDDSMDDDMLLQSTITTEKSYKPSYFDESMDDDMLFESTLKAEKSVAPINWNRAPKPILKKIQYECQLLENREKFDKSLKTVFHPSNFKRIHVNFRRNLITPKGEADMTDWNETREIHQDLNQNFSTEKHYYKNPDKQIKKTRKMVNKYCFECGDPRTSEGKCISCERIMQIWEDAGNEVVQFPFYQNRQELIENTYELAYGSAYGPRIDSRAVTELND